MTLVEFLLARIAEDETQAHKHWADASRHGWGSYTAHVFGECQSKRRIVERYIEIGGRGRQYLEERVTLGWVVRCLALTYADHPDYQQEWRP